MSSNISNSQISEFYNKFSSYQKKTGINIRIRTIFKFLKEAGLKSNSKVLEIGCGVGTLTSLIAKHVNKGLVVSTDISPEGIKKAKEMNKQYERTEFIVSDMLDFKHKTIFDFVVLADVLEHIPLENHKALFKTIREHVHSDSVIAINIPSPQHIEWIRKFEPENLQIIDQALYTDVFLSNIYPNDFYLESLKSYSLYHQNPDYQWIILKPNKGVDHFTKKSRFNLRKQEIESRLFY